MKEVLSWEANQFLTKMCVSTISRKSCWKSCTQGCHYVVWTPVGTKDFLVDRDDSYIELLLKYLYKLIHFVNACVAFRPLIAVIIPGLARTEINHSTACNKCIVVQFQKKTENGYYVFSAVRKGAPVYIYIYVV